MLIDGLSAERVLFQDRVTGSRQVQMLDLLLQSFRGRVVPSSAAETTAATR